MSAPISKKTATPVAPRSKGQALPAPLEEDKLAKAIEISRKEEESRRLLVEQRKKQEEEERIKREREEAKKKQEEELRRKKQEEEEKKKQMEEEIRKRIELEKKMAEERKRKIEEERQKRLEEQRRIEAEKRAIEEQIKQIAEEERRLKEEKELARKLPLQPAGKKMLTMDDIDLLGGGVEEDEDERVDEIFSSSLRQSESQSPRPSSSSAYKFHRNSPQRGPIDESVDNLLDTLPIPPVPIKKQGRTDGVYLYGARIMRVSKSRTGELSVIVGTNKLQISDFFNKYERTEVIRMKGLQSALIVATFVGSQKTQV